MKYLPPSETVCLHCDSPHSEHDLNDDCPKVRVPVFKTVYEITVLSEGRFLSDSLQEIEYAITDGDCIGSFEEVSSQEVPKSEVPELLVSIGNDGTFFDFDT